MRNRHATPIIDAVRRMHLDEGRDPYNTLRPRPDKWRQTTTDEQRAHAEALLADSTLTLEDRT